MPSPNRIRELQIAAALVACELLPGSTVRRIILVSERGEKIADLPVPPCAEVMRPAAEPEPEVAAVVGGWHFVPSQAGSLAAFFDGRLVKQVATNRVKLLQALADAAAPMSAKELASAVFGEHGDPENARFHLRKLRDELKEAFPTFEGDIVANDGAGYRLVLR